MLHLHKHESIENLAPYAVFSQKSSKLPPGMEPGQTTWSWQGTTREQG